MLGAVLIRAAAIDDVADVVTPADMYAPKHETILAAVLAMHRAGEAVDAVTVADRLAKTGELAHVGGAPYLGDLVSGVETAANAGYYARIVAEHATLRRLHAACIRGVQLAEAGEGDVDELIEMVRGELDAVAAHRPGGQVSFIGDTIDDTLDSFEHPLTAVATGWPDLDTLIKGWRPGGLYVVAARPGVGKSIIGAQAAVELAKSGVVAFSSLEMPRTELETRIVAHLAHVNLSRIDGRTMTEEDWARIARHRGELADLRLAIDDRSRVSVADVRAHARAASRRGPLAGVVVDYLQLMSSPPGDRRSRQEVVASFSRDLKILAKELQVPVIALSQLNRGPEARQDRRPTLADLRESGAIEQDADVVMLLHETDEGEGVDIDLLLAKNRQGQKDVVRLTREGWYSRMSPRPWRPSPPAPTGERPRYAD